MGRGAEFGGWAANLVAAANQSAVQLVKLVLMHFPGKRSAGCVVKLPSSIFGVCWKRQVCYRILRHRPDCLSLLCCPALVCPAGFRDTSVYKGALVHFYKRAQILVGDIWAASSLTTAFPRSSATWA
jgi:hypothetical protein